MSATATYPPIDFNLPALKDIARPLTAAAPAAVAASPYLGALGVGGLLGHGISEAFPGFTSSFQDEALGSYDKGQYPFEPLVSKTLKNPLLGIPGGGIIQQLMNTYDPTSTSATGELDFTESGGTETGGPSQDPNDKGPSKWDRIKKWGPAALTVGLIGGQPIFNKISNVIQAKEAEAKRKEWEEYQDSLDDPQTVMGHLYDKYYEEPSLDTWLRPNQ